MACDGLSLSLGTTSALPALPPYPMRSTPYHYTCHLPGVAYPATAQPLPCRLPLPVREGPQAAAVIP